MACGQVVRRGWQQPVHRHSALDMADTTQRQRSLVGASLQRQSLRQFFAVQSGIDDGGDEVVGDRINHDYAWDALCALQTEPLAETRIGQGTLEWRVSADQLDFVE